MAPRRHALVVPDLGLPLEIVTVSSWLVRRGSEVHSGERVVELLAGAVTVDLSAPASGRLVRIMVHDDERAFTGQVLGEIAEEDPEAGD